MSETATIAQTTYPVTEASLTRDLGELNIGGMTLLVHSSLSALGWVCGGPVAVIGALLRAVGEPGTLVMPAQSGDLSDPAHWRNPPVPEAWWATIRETMPAFDPSLTPTRGMGAVAELFRTYPGVIRSHHPTASFAARGPRAASLMAEQPLEDPFNSLSPLGKLYDVDGSILLLGVGHGSNTTLHLAERKALGERQAHIRSGALLIIKGHRQWVRFTEPDLYSDDFADVGEAFERATAQVTLGRVGQARARLIPVRALVDYAVPWFQKRRTL